MVNADAVRFDGRIAVVTGAGRGLGREFCLLLAQRGASVVVNDVGRSADARRYRDVDVDASDPATAVADEIRSSGGVAVANRADVSDPLAAASIIDQAIAEFGRCDIVINNAGVVISGPFEDLTANDLATSWGVHVLGSFNVIKAAWQHMRERGSGHILNVCSVDGVLFGNDGYSIYDAAKGGLAGLTRGLAVEAARQGIVVNGLLPGALTRGQKSAHSSASPAGRLDMSPALVAPPACWLVHDECDVSGKFFIASSGRMGTVFTSVAEGYQTAAPDTFSLEEVRENWPQVQAPDPAITPASVGEFNDFRVEIYRRVVGNYVPPG
jgi:NAD(P)-dependent dehydrogenase (short-subunit alcohol dehydrogenase family)